MTDSLPYRTYHVGEVAGVVVVFRYRYAELYLSKTTPRMFNLGAISGCFGDYQYWGGIQAVHPLDAYYLLL